MNMIWTAWRGGSYGFKVSKNDRNQYFKKTWSTVIIELPVGDNFIKVEANVNKPSCWNDTCRELISSRIKDWLTLQELINWKNGYPPKFEVKVINERVFQIIKIFKNGKTTDM